MTRSPSVDPVLLGRVREALADEALADEAGATSAGPPPTGRVAAAVRSAAGLGGVRPSSARPAGRAELVLGGDRLLELVDAAQSELTGAGPLEPLLDDPEVTDVLVNGVDGVWVDRGLGLEPVDLELGGAEDVRRLAVRLAALAGRRLDDAAPWVDARLPDGTRLHAVLPPVVQGGAHISLRVPRRRALSLPDLVAAGTVPRPWETVLRALVMARAAYLVTGGTGAGKTTLLAALLALVGPTERLVVVEDAAELQVRHPHVVRLEGRPPNVEGVGEITMTRLVRQALRMRPDRLVVGEVRGAEVRELLAAFNTGHEGGCGTVHANTTADLPARLEALGALAGLDRAAVQAQAGSALEVLVHVRREAARRWVSELAVVRPGRGSIQVLPAASCDVRGLVRREAGWSALVDRLGLATQADSAVGGP